MHYFFPPSDVIVHPHTFPLLSPCATFQDDRPPSPRFLGTFTQCPQYSTKAQENGVLNSEFNYSRPSEMLVSRWIKPGSLSKPIFDLKGKHMCFRHIAIPLSPLGTRSPSAVWAKGLRTVPKLRLTPERRRKRQQEPGFTADGGCKSWILKK